MLLTDPFVSVICRENECKFSRESDSPKKILEIMKEHHNTAKHYEFTYIYTLECTIQNKDIAFKIEEPNVQT